MWRLDHHKNLFGTNKATPFIKGEGDWNLSNRIGNNTNNFMGSNMPCAGSSTFNDPNAYKNQHMTSEQRAKGIHTSDGDMIKMFRDKLASRGARGIFGMKRVFKIMDDNNNGTLEVQEFWKAVKDFRINLNQDEARHLFDLFDRNGDGTVDYDEILRAVAGDMNKFRVALVRKAFQILDKTEMELLNSMTSRVSTMENNIQMSKQERRLKMKSSLNSLIPLRCTTQWPIQHEGSQNRMGRIH